MTARRNLPSKNLPVTARVEKWRQRWRQITAPKAISPIDAQREYILRVMLLLGQLLTYPATIIFAIGAYIGIFPPALPVTLIIVSLSLSGGWVLTVHGYWRTARFLIIALPYLVATFIGEKYTVGIVSGLLYAQAIFVTAILVRGYTPWLVTGIIGVTIIGISWFRMEGFLAPDVRYANVFAASTISVLFNLMMLVILGYFFVSEYQRSFLEEHRQSKLLEETNRRLTAEISQRMAAEEKLQQSLAEKELLLREIHHRVKNNLQTVASLLYLQSRHIDNPVALEALKNSYDRVQSMALIHQQLYQNTDLGHIDLQNYVDVLLKQLRSSFRGDVRIRFFTEIEPVQFDLDTTIPIGLIINELVTNAMQHGFPHNQPGEIHVTFHENNGKYTLTIRDTGVGLSETQKARLAENGVAAITGNSLGLQLVQKLTKQLHGKLSISSGTHTIFSVTFQE